MFLPCRVLIGCTKFLAKHPCTRCLVLKEDIRNLGTKCDMQTRVNKQHTDNEEFRRGIENAREYIYKYGAFINGKIIDLILGPQSLVPTRVSQIPVIWCSATNCITECLFCSTLPIWIQLLFNASARFTSQIWVGGSGMQFLPILWGFWMQRVMTASRNWITGAYPIQYLDDSLIASFRYCQITTFGCGMIWRFHSNASSMKRLAGHDFEDLLQVS